MHILIIIFFALINIAHPEEEGHQGGNINLTELNDDPLFVSLGSTSCPAGILRNCELRKAAFPLDWVLSVDSEKLIEMLDDDFHKFTNEDYLIPNSLLMPYTSSSALFHTGYHLEFLYEGDWEGLNYVASMEKFKNKYERRIERFKTIRNYKGKVFFIRTSWPDGYTDPARYFKCRENNENTELYSARLSGALRRFFPNINFTLIVINFDHHPKEILVEKKFSDGTIEIRIAETDFIEDIKKYFRRLDAETRSSAYSSSSAPCRQPTSSSDSEEYNHFCWAAVKDPEVFAQFKNAAVYNGILEHVTFEQGKAYLEVIKKQTPELLERIEEFRKNDAIGHPKTYFYEEIGEISPTTLRYMKVASDLLLLFGPDLAHYSIVEIGGGYGGQCKILSDLSPLKSYTIIDLPSAVALTKKYLEQQKVDHVNFATNEESPKDSEFDLVISNYSFCECTEEMQTKYVKEILSLSKRGYLTCNSGYEGGSKEDLLKRLTDAHIIWSEHPEEPLTHLKNYLLTWDHTGNR